MSTSLTWQELPPHLLAPLLQGVISLAEAAELWDLLLLHPGQWISPPPHLTAALERLDLWQMQAEPTRH